MSRTRGFQVKIRGFRVDLGEIESVLAAQTGITQAVAVTREYTPGDKRLVAYVRPSEATEIDEAALRNTVRGTLPDYMVPARIVALEAFPMTPAGKVDREALPAPLETTSEAGPEDGQPQGQVEATLAALLRRLLRIPRVGRHDNFFDLGGHSLLAVSYFNEIHQAYGIKLPLAMLFHAGTVAQLAAEIEDGNRRDSRLARCLVPIQSEGTKPNFFCVHGAGGNVLFYRELSKRMGPDIPFYGLQSRGLDGNVPPLTSIEEMANAYVEEIKTIQRRRALLPWWLLSGGGQSPTRWPDNSKGLAIR